MEKRISMHPHKPHATGQPSRFSNTHTPSTDSPPCVTVAPPTSCQLPQTHSSVPQNHLLLPVHCVSHVRRVLLCARTTTRLMG